MVTTLQKIQFTVDLVLIDKYFYFREANVSQRSTAGTRTSKRFFYSSSRSRAEAEPVVHNS